MKKLFTFFMALMVTAVAFGQINKPVYRLDEPVTFNGDRNHWAGNSAVEYYTTFNEGEIYFLTFPAAETLPSNATIDEVTFGWQATPDNFDPNFKIVIYVGGNTNWLVQNPDPNQATWYTDDMNNMGTRMYEQIVDASASTSRGLVTVALTTPFQVSSANGGQIWVGIECLGNTCGYISGLDNPDINNDWAFNLNKYTASSTNADRIAPPLYYYDEERTQLFSARYTLAVHINDGTAEVESCNWRVDMYTLDTYEDQDSPDSMYIDPYTLMDSLYLAPAIWNGGISTSTQDGNFRIYIENSTAEDFYNFLLSEATEDLEVEAGRGFIFSNLGGLMAFDQMNDLGLTFPFTVCAEFTYSGLDPDPNNNIDCIVLTDQPLDDGDGVQNHSAQNLTVSPNPASTTISVENAAGAEISIYNVAGQKVMSIENADANETINISSLSEGVYVVRMVNGNEVATSKLNIVR